MYCDQTASLLKTPPAVAHLQRARWSGTSAGTISLSFATTRG